ncbi:MAG: hypothetical protein WAR57_01440 [Candidatus Phosphoribacter sp.]|nr:hypothetical protein [Actinomycetales bacterium]
MILATAMGAAAGLALAVVARAAMLLLADPPEPTVSGTLFIAAAFLVAGGSVGLVSAARRDGRSRWWRLAAGLGLGTFMGAGALLLPLTILAGAVLAGQRPRWLRRATVSLVLLGTSALVFVASADGDPFGSRFTSLRFLVGCLLMAGVAMAMALAAATVFAPWSEVPGRFDPRGDPLLSLETAR